MKKLVRQVEDMEVYIYEDYDPIGDREIGVYGNDKEEKTVIFGNDEIRVKIPYETVQKLYNMMKGK